MARASNGRKNWHGRKRPARRTPQWQDAKLAQAVGSSQLEPEDESGVKVATQPAFLMLALVGFVQLFSSRAFPLSFSQQVLTRFIVCKY